MLCSLLYPSCFIIFWNNRTSAKNMLLLMLPTAMTSYAIQTVTNDDAHSLCLMTYMISFVCDKQSEYFYRHFITFFVKTVNIYRRKNFIIHLKNCVSSYIFSLSMLIFVSNLIKDGVPMVKHSLANAMALANKKKQVTHRKRMSPSGNNTFPVFP